MFVYVMGNWTSGTAQGHEADPIHVQMRALAKARGLDLDSLLDRAAMLFESPKSSPRLEPLDDHDIAILIEDDEHDYKRIERQSLRRPDD